jgi:hypothetical protein
MPSMPAKGFGQADTFTWFEQSLWLSLNRSLLRPQGVDQAVSHLGRLHSKAHQPTDAFGETHKLPAWG